MAKKKSAPQTKQVDKPEVEQVDKPEVGQGDKPKPNPGDHYQAIVAVAMVGELDKQQHQAVARATREWSRTGTVTPELARFVEEIATEIGRNIDKYRKMATNIIS